jgi:hypothetical protein
MTPATVAAAPVPARNTHDRVVRCGGLTRTLITTTGA